MRSFQIALPAALVCYFAISIIASCSHGGNAEDQTLDGNLDADAADDASDDADDSSDDDSGDDDDWRDR